MAETEVEVTPAPEPEKVIVSPPAIEHDAVVAEEAATAAAAEAEKTPAEGEATPEPPKKAQEPWFMKRIHQQSAKIADLGRNTELTVAELAAARAEIAALKAGKVPDATTPPVAPVPEPVRAAPENLTQAQVQAEAQRIVAEQRFNDACNAVFDAGKSEFPDFEDAVRTVGATGVLTPPFLEAVTSLDNSAKVLYELGKNPEEAQRIAALSPTKQAVELAKLDMNVAKVAAKPVSRASAPIKPVNGAVRTTTEPSDDDDTATWMKKRRAQKAARMNA
jgi:hypothetical protein